MAMESKYVWMDGRLVDYEKATLHFLTPALHYGAGVFEGIRCYQTERGPAIFRLYEHMERMVTSAKLFGFRSIPFTADQLTEAAKETVHANGFKDCYIRPMMYLAGGGWNLNVDGGRLAVGIAAWEWNHYLGEEALEKGIRANISSFTRHHINVSMTKAKVSGNYANSFLAKTESARLGFEEAIMLDPQGYVAECTGENIFIVRKGQVFTPHTSTILEGITRNTIALLAEDLGYQIHEQAISRDQLYISDEVFVCGTAAECIAICEIDFRTIGTGKMGTVTRQIQQAYQEAIHGCHPRSEAWCDYVQ
jgi:branched-chain amino acid aminotransferase